MLAGRETDTNLVEVRHLTKHFPVYSGLILRKQVGAVRAVDGISFSIKEGTSFGLVGESGCGKTTVAKLLLLLEKITSGSIYFAGIDTEKMSSEQGRAYRRSVQAVFQDPFSSLNPRMRVGTILSEPIRVHQALPEKDIPKRVAELLQIVGLRLDAGRLYPHEFSGGQRQRIAVARALALNPRFIILDEPVSALDVSIRAQILNLLMDIQEKFGLTYLIIAHDLAVVEHVSHAMAVMYLGKIVESAPTEELYANPLHPYTRALLAAVPHPDPGAAEPEFTLSGEVPSPLNPPLGCRFHPRCWQVKPICSEEEPPLREVGHGHQVACHLP